MKNIIPIRLSLCQLSLVSECKHFEFKRCILITKSEVPCLSTSTV